MTGKIKQYRPSFFSGFENEDIEFNSVEELLAIDWVKNFANESNQPQPKFHQFSISELEHPSDELKYLLMAEYKEGTEWYVVGYINATEIINTLPTWKPKESEDEK
jgi:hypothetical protein